MDCWDALLERQVRRPWLSSNYPPLAILSMLPRCRCCQSLSTSRPTSITTFQVGLMLVCCFVKLTKCSSNLDSSLSSPKEVVGWDRDMLETSASTTGRRSSDSTSLAQDGHGAHMGRYPLPRTAFAARPLRRHRQRPFEGFRGSRIHPAMRPPALVTTLLLPPVLVDRCTRAQKVPWQP